MDNLIERFLKKGNNDVSELLKIIIQYTESRTYVLSISDGRVITNERTMTHRNELSNTTHKSTKVYNNIESTDSYIIIPIERFTLLLAGNKQGYASDLSIELEPFTNLLGLIIQDDSCGDMFLVNMSHEIRTPLNGVIGYSQLMNETELSTKQKSYMKSIKECSIQLMQIINNILDVSRLNSGKINSRIECFSVMEIMDKVRDVIGRKLKHKNQKLTIHISRTVPRYLVMDKHKLTQVMVNLVTNANKFTPDDGDIHISVQKSKDNILNISVSDDGIGIHPDDVNKLFKTFIQLENRTEENGSGLGLAICKKLVNLMGGDIHVESELGNGSIFIFDVEFKNCDEVENDIKLDLKHLIGKNVMIVDENVENRILLTDQLLELDMKPNVYGTSKEALLTLMNSRFEFELAVVDINIIASDGLSLIKKIKKLLPLLPVIAICSNGCVEDSIDFEYKLKTPINKVQLYERILRVVEDKKEIRIDSESDSDSCSSPSSSFVKTLRILVAEDVHHNRELIMSILEKFGYTNIDVAENGEIAIEMMDKSMDEKDPYDIVLLDLHMPKASGYDVIRHINDSRWKLPKIIVVTASVSQNERETCKQMGVKYFVSKPINLKELQRVVIKASYVDF